MPIQKVRTKQMSIARQLKNIQQLHHSRQLNNSRQVKILEIFLISEIFVLLLKQLELMVAGSMATLLHTKEDLSKQITHKRIMI